MFACNKARENSFVSELSPELTSRTYLESLLMSVSRNAVAKTADPSHAAHDPEDETLYLLSLKDLGLQRAVTQPCEAAERTTAEQQELYRYCWDKARQGEGPEAAPKLTRGREPHGSTHRSPHLGNQRGTRRNTRARDLGNEGLLAFWVPEKLSEVLTAKQNMPPPFCSRAEVGSAYRYAAEVGRAQVRVVTSWAELKLSG